MDHSDHLCEPAGIRRRLRGERGQAVSLALVVTAVIAATMASALADLGRAAVDRQRARTAADAAALAGVTGGRSAAADLAARHDAELVGWERHGEEVVVVVRSGDARGTARATDVP